MKLACLFCFLSTREVCVCVCVCVIFLIYVCACPDSLYRQTFIPFANFRGETFSFMQSTNPCLVVIDKLQEQICVPFTFNLFYVILFTY